MAKIIFTKDFMTKVTDYLDKSCEHYTDQAKIDNKNRLLTNLLKYWSGNARHLKGLIPEEIRDPASSLITLRDGQTVLTFDKGELKSFRTVFARVAATETVGFFSVITLSVLNNQILRVYRGNLTNEDIQPALAKPHFVLISENTDQQLPTMEEVIPLDKESPYYYEHV